ncbi:hypothetical protein S21ZY_068 [Pseudomonas phage ZY21]|nr:hypothetical protein S21ZY_068 [Pseudomonas phage ZY21]
MPLGTIYQPQSSKLIINAQINSETPNETLWSYL